MALIILNKLVDQAISSGFDILSDMSREPLEREDWDTMSGGVMSIIWELRQVKRMSALITLIEQDTLSILGYDSETGLDDLFKDAGFESGSATI